MTCVYCGANENVTLDHVPPRCLIRKPYPANLLTVPACALCNNAYSRDEEYFRLVIVGLLCHTQESESLFDGPIARSMNRNPGMEDLMFGSIAATSGAVLLDIEYARVYRIAEKIARGLEYISSRVPYPPNQRFNVEFVEVESGSEQTAFAPDFTYCRSSDLCGWEFTLFDSVRFVVLAAADKNVCPM